METWPFSGFRVVNFENFYQRSFRFDLPLIVMTKKVVLVTGGTGLVGNGIRIAHERDPRDDETFVFLSSKDADLTDKESTRKASFHQFVQSVFLSGLAS